MMTAMSIATLRPIGIMLSPTIPAIYRHGEAEKDVKIQNKHCLVKVEGNHWGDVRQDIPTKLKDNVYKTAIKPAMAYGAECWVVRK